MDFPVLIEKSNKKVIAKVCKPLMEKNPGKKS